MSHKPGCCFAGDIKIGSANEAQCWTFSNGKQLVTVRMNQVQSQLVLGTKTVLISDHVHSESSSALHMRMMVIHN